MHNIHQVKRHKLAIVLNKMRTCLLTNHISGQAVASVICAMKISRMATCEMSTARSLTDIV